MLWTLQSKFRTRYFVLNAAEGALQYYENKVGGGLAPLLQWEWAVLLCAGWSFGSIAHVLCSRLEMVHGCQTKRKLNVNPRSVPFMSLYSVVHIRDKRGKKTKSFQLKIMSGRVFEFVGKSMADTEKYACSLAVRLVVARLWQWLLSRLAVGGGVTAALCSTRQVGEQAAVRAASRQRGGRQNPVRVPHAPRQEGTCSPTGSTVWCPRGGRGTVRDENTPFTFHLCPPRACAVPCHGVSRVPSSTPFSCAPSLCVCVCARESFLTRPRLSLPRVVFLLVPLLFFIFSRLFSFFLCAGLDNRSTQ